MLRDIRLRFWPSYHDCLRWSQSGVVAVMASEYVHILVPAKEDSKKIKGTPQFEITKADLRVLSDETDNIVVNEPANIYSIGEEQGPGYVKAIEWSPLGVSRNRGCNLAILTTTHKLKIFEADGHASMAWKVTADVSQIMTDWDGWSAVERNLQDEEKMGLTEAMVVKLRGRTRGIAWSLGCMFEERKWGESILAVTNDFREIVFLHVRPGSCKVVHVFKPDHRPGPGFYPKMTWSPWKSTGKDTGESFLTIANRGKVLLYRVKMVAVSAGSGEDVKMSTESVDPFVVGQAVTEVHPIMGMIWYKEEVEGYSILVYAIQQYLRIVAIHSTAKEFVVGKTAQVWEFENGFIDPMSGLTITPSAASKTCIDIHLSTLLGKTQIVTWDLLNLRGSAKTTKGSAAEITPTKNALSTATLSPDTGTPKEKINENSWEYVIQDRKQDFIAEWDLNSATCKIWGVAGSPLGGVVAAVISNEPDDSLQYITHSKETSRLVFGVQLEGGEFVKRIYGGDVLAPVTTCSSENFILECANLHDPEPQTLPSASAPGTAASTGGSGKELRIQTSSKTAFDVLKSTLQERSTRDPVCNVRILQTSSTPSLITALSRNMYHPSTLTATRYLTCLRLFPQSRHEDGTPIIPLHTPEPAVIASIIGNILQATQAISPTDGISKTVVYNAVMVGLIGLWKFEDGALVPELLKGLEWLKKHCGDGIDLSVEIEFVKKRAAGMKTKTTSSGGNGGGGSGERGGRGGKAGGRANTNSNSSSKHQQNQQDTSPTLTEREKEILESDGVVRDKCTKCKACGEGFRWDDIEIAECGGGHRFPRCAITAMPIQAGYTWKTCSICERVVIDSLPAMASPQSSELLQALLKAWDICVHCGGRYR